MSLRELLCETCEENVEAMPMVGLYICVEVVAILKEQEEEVYSREENGSNSNS